MSAFTPTAATMVRLGHAAMCIKPLVRLFRLTTASADIGLTPRCSRRRSRDRRRSRRSNPRRRGTPRPRFYHHRGRAGDMLRVSGIWISPAEIEDVLAGIRSISETAAVLGQSEIGLAEIVLYVVP